MNSSAPADVEGLSLTSPDVVIIQKQTALERYTRRPLNIDFFEYLEKAGQDVETLVKAHDEHAASRESLLTSLGKMGISWEILNLDELGARGLGFFRPEHPTSGLNPKARLVLALGGDGTLLHASHYVGHDVHLLGINSCPGHSVGHLCAAVRENAADVIAKHFEGQSRVETIRRLQVKVGGGQSLPLGLNDVLFANRHPGATCRYLLSVVDGTTRAEEKSERQLSSGVWISAPAGATAAISSYGLRKPALHEKVMLFAVREPYIPEGQLFYMRSMELDGDRQELTLFCRIRQGLICVDGADSCAHLGFGDVAEISLPAAGALNLMIR